MPGFLGLFIDSIAPHFNQLVCFCHSPLNHELGMMDYKIKSTNVILVDIGPHLGIPKRVLSALLNGGGMFNSPIPLDAFLVRASTPLLPFIYKKYKSKVCLLLVSDAVEGLDNLGQPKWRLFLIKLWANWYQKTEDRIAEKVLTFVNSVKLYSKLEPKVKSLELIKTTTLREIDFFEREDTCQNKVIEFIYAGRITRNKGMFDILDALANIKKEGFEFRFNLVGIVDKGDSIIEDMEQRANTLGIGDSLIFHGYKPAGDELLAYYRRADIFIIASQGSSEGFPRTIWEAMASSLPVIATSVSSIPGYIGSCAEIVEPLNVGQLTDGIRKVITNSDVRKLYIHKGMKLAKENTLEARAVELVDKLKNKFSK
jgi:glycosyltransferase involved in cell wall biosynthesis